MSDLYRYTDLDPIPDAHIISCADCGAELLAQPGDTFTHNDDGSHTYTPAQLLVNADSS